jgi:DNA repair protein RadD
MTLRPYQQEAVESFFAHAREVEQARTLVVAPTGSGKSHIIAAISKRVIDNSKHNVLILQHRKELIDQNAKKIIGLGAPCKVYSAGLNSKKIGRITLAGIQSIYRKASLLPRIGLVIIDEAHLLSPEGEGMYRSLLNNLIEKNPELKLLGLTATPYRMKTGMLVDDEGLFDSICYDVDLRSLIKDGYLSPIISKGSVEAIETGDIKIRAREFALEQAAEKFNTEKLEAVIREIRRYAYDRKSILVFCSTVESAEHFTKMLRHAGERAECVTGNSLFRDEAIRKFKNGDVRFLVNCEVLTTGFDAPNSDALVLLRPTKSPGLYCQIVGRIMRTHPGKENGLVLDFCGNIERHGPIDEISVRTRMKKDKGKFIELNELSKAPCKFCPECRTANATRATQCSECGHVWDMTEQYEDEASSAEVMRAEESDFEVRRVIYSRHEKTGKPDSFKIEYEVGLTQSVSEFLCFDHGGFAAHKALEIWRRHCVSETVTPRSVDEAIELAKQGKLRNVCKIKVRREGKFWRPVAWKYAEGRGEVLDFKGVPQHVDDTDAFDPFADLGDFDDCPF